MVRHSGELFIGGSYAPYQHFSRRQFLSESHTDGFPSQCFRDKRGVGSTTPVDPAVCVQQRGSRATTPVKCVLLPCLQLGNLGAAKLCVSVGISMH